MPKWAPTSSITWRAPFFGQKVGHDRRFVDARMRLSREARRSNGYSRIARCYCQVFSLDLCEVPDRKCLSCDLKLQFQTSTPCAERIDAASIQLLMCNLVSDWNIIGIPRDLVTLKKVVWVLVGGFRQN